MKKINGGIIFLIILLFICLIVLSLFILVDNNKITLFNKNKQNADVTNDNLDIKGSTEDETIDYAKFIQNLKQSVSDDTYEVVSMADIMPTKVTLVEGKLYIEEKLVDTDVLVFYNISVGNSGYDMVYYIKEDGSWHELNVVEVAFEHKEPQPKKLNYSNIVAVFEVSGTEPSTASCPVFVDVYGTLYSDNLNENLNDNENTTNKPYEKFTASLKASKSKYTIYQTSMADIMPTIVRLKEGKLYIEEKLVDTDVLVFYNISVGNSGYDTVYYIKEDGSLYAFNAGEVAFEHKEPQTQKLNYSNIVAVLQGVVTYEIGGAYPIFIDIYGNLYR